MKKRNKERRKFECMRPSKAREAVYNLLQTPSSADKYQQVKELSHWQAPAPTYVQLREYLEALNHKELLDAYGPVESDSEAADIITRMMKEDPALAEGFVLDQLEHLIHAGVEKRVIAQIMGVSDTTVYLWGEMIAKRRQQQYDSLPPWIVPGFAGDVLHTYERLKHLGFQMIHEEGAAHYKQMQGVSIVLRAQQAIVKYQAKLGYYDDKSKLLPSRPDAGSEQDCESGPANFPISDLMRLEEIIQAAMHKEAAQQRECPAAGCIAQNTNPT